MIPEVIIKPGKKFFPASWTKFPSNKADYPPVLDCFPYVFLYFSPLNHNTFQQGASCLASFF